jgi:hypothetical protein
VDGLMAVMVDMGNSFGGYVQTSTSAPAEPL